MIYILKNIHIKFILFSSFIAFALVQGSLIQEAPGMESEEAPGTESEETSFVLRKRSRASHERDTHRESPYRTPRKKRPRASSYKENIPPHNSPYKESEKKEESLDLLPSEPLPPDEHIVWPENVTDLQKLTMHMIQKAFYRPVVSEGSPNGRHQSNTLKVDLTKITPEKITVYKALGGNTPTLRENFKSVMGKYSPIRNTELFPESTLKTFSPVAIEVLRDRETIKKARETDAVISLPPIAHLVPYIPETTEERLLRKERQRLDFEAVEAMKGHTPEALKGEISDVATMFKGYFDYITYRKTEWKKGTGAKLRWYDKIDAFDKFVTGQPGIIRIECEGYDVFAFSQTIDLKRENILTEDLNSDRMKNGLCPIGADGEEMDYHHLTRIDAKTHPHYGSSDPGGRSPFRIVLLPQSIHTSYSGIWHLSGKFYQDLPKKSILRGEFGAAREKMNQAILAYLLDAFSFI
jgi:hypothetical protein